MARTTRGCLWPRLVTASPQNDVLAKKSKDLTVAIDGVLDGVSGTTVGLTTANQELTSALSVAESSDRAVPSQALAVYAEARAAARQRISEWAELKKGSLADLNRQLNTSGLAPIAIAEIERDVYYLMTR